MAPVYRASGHRVARLPWNKLFRFRQPRPFSIKALAECERTNRFHGGSFFRIPLKLPLHSQGIGVPATCLVATLSRLNTLVVAIARSNAESARSS